MTRSWAPSRSTTTTTGFLSPSGDALLRQHAFGRGHHEVWKSSTILALAFLLQAPRVYESVQGWVDGQSSQTVASLLFNDASYAACAVHDGAGARPAAAAISRDGEQRDQRR